MLEILSQNPHKMVTVEDDKEAKTLLFELGLIDKFSKNPLLGASTAQAVTHGDHPTHFVFAMLFLGKTAKQDNGYLVYCLPKSQYPPSKAMEFVRTVLKSQGKVAVAKPLSGTSAEN